jgi:hypothetical protein
MWLTVGAGQTTEAEAAYAKVEAQLKAQIALCREAKMMAHTAGDKARELSLHRDQRIFEQDLDVLSNARARADPVPAFFYAERTFTRVVAFPELQDTTMEVTVLHAQALPLPTGFRTLDTHVTVEAEYPKETPQTATSPVVKHSIDPGAHRRRRARVCVCMCICVSVCMYICVSVFVRVWATHPCVLNGAVRCVSSVQLHVQADDRAAQVVRDVCAAAVADGARALQPGLPAGHGRAWPRARAAGGPAPSQRNRAEWRGTSPLCRAVRPRVFSPRMSCVCMYAAVAG